VIDLCDGRPHRSSLGGEPFKRSVTREDLRDVVCTTHVIDVDQVDLVAYRVGVHAVITATHGMGDAGRHANTPVSLYLAEVRISSLSLMPHLTPTTSGVGDPPAWNHKPSQEPEKLTQCHRSASLLYSSLSVVARRPNTLERGKEKSGPGVKPLSHCFAGKIAPELSCGARFDSPIPCCQTL
jgi:hypothetical protein